MAEIDFCGRKIGNGNPVFIIAEVGVNHDGDFKKACFLMEMAKKAGADAVKFQKRNLEALYAKETLEHPEACGEHGFQYALEVQQKVEFGQKEFENFKLFAQALDLIFICTPFDEPSVDFLENLGVCGYKVASADLTNFLLLEKIIGTGKPILVSTGMSTLQELLTSVSFLNRAGARHRFALLHCQSTYPANISDLNLKLISFYRNQFGIPVGYSGHERDLDTTLAAVALGTCVIERHITRSKKDIGPDHAASLEPQEFTELVKGIRKIEKALGKEEKTISQGEAINRQVLGKSLVAVIDINPGDKISRDVVTAKSVPEKGLSPQRVFELIGRVSKRSIKRDGVFKKSDLLDVVSQRKWPEFHSRWGLKAALNDFEKRIVPGMQLLEFHLTEPELSFMPPKKTYELEAYYHVPVYGSGGMVVDLCSLDNEIWEESIKITQASIVLARRWSKNFIGKPRVVMHVGGMTIEPVGPEVWPEMLVRATQAFRKLDTKGVDFLPENLISLAFHKGGQWYQNVFNKPGEISGFCKCFGLKMCFDTSHAWVAACYYNFDYYNFVKECAPYIAHLHLVDGKAPNQEGLQIGDGDVDFSKVFDIIREYGSPDAKISWVPEIWMGHLNDYEGFFIALERLTSLNHPFLGAVQ